MALGTAGTAVASACPGWGVCGPAIPLAANACKLPDLVFVRRKR